MESMNWKRVFAGGLVAAIVMLVGEFAIEPLMGPQMEQFFTRLNLPVPGEEAMPLFAFGILLTGFTAVWLYAAIRTRFGPGLQTAVCAGVTTWFLSCMIPNLAMLAFGLFTTSLFWFSSLFPLVEIVAATVVGAWVYRET